MSESGKPYLVKIYNAKRGETGVNAFDGIVVLPNGSTRDFDFTSQEYGVYSIPGFGRYRCINTTYIRDERITVYELHECPLDVWIREPETRDRISEAVQRHRLSSIDSLIPTPPSSPPASTMRQPDIIPPPPPLKRSNAFIKDSESSSSSSSSSLTKKSKSKK
jgi:hypothetical protein